MNASSRTIGSSGIFLVALGLLAAAGSTSAMDDPTVEELLAELQAPELQSRESASKALLEREELGLKDIEELMESPVMGPEQRARLQAIARDRFSRTPRAAIGVSFEPGGFRIQPGVAGQPQGFRVTEVHTGFPAKDKNQLRPRDEIRRVGGFEVDSGVMQSMRPYIICHDPGDVIKMEVVRDGQTIDVDVELGSFTALPRLQGASDQITPDQVLDAWRVRGLTRPRAAGDLIPVVSVLLPESEPALNSAMGIEQSVRARARRGDWPGVVAGGMSREVSDDASVLADMAPEPMVRPGPVAGQANLEQLTAEEISLQSRRDWINLAILDAQRQMAANDQLPNGRREANKRIQSLMQSLKQTNSRITVLRDQIAAQKAQQVQKVRP